MYCKIIDLGNMAPNLMIDASPRQAGYQPVGVGNIAHRTVGWAYLVPIAGNKETGNVKCL